MSNIDFELPGTTPTIDTACEVQSADMKKPVKFTAIWVRLERSAAQALGDEMRADGQELMNTRRRLQEYDAYSKALEKGEVLEKFADIDLGAEMSEMYRLVDELNEKRIERLKEYFQGVKGFPSATGKKHDILPEDTENVEGLLDRMLSWDHYVDGLSESLDHSINPKKLDESKAKN